MTGSRSKASAFCVPATANSASPRAVEHEDGAAQPVDAGKPVEGDRARQKGDGKVSPVADRCRRDRPDHEIAGDASEVSRDERQDQNAEQVEPALDSGDGSAEREDEGAGKVEPQQEHVHRGRPSRTGRSRAGASRIGHTKGPGF
jgi:hypothetical protein